MKELTLIGKGRMADIFAWGQDKILKLNPQSYPVALAEREALITQTAQAAGIPVPTVFDVIEYQGRYGIVFEKIVGHSLLDEIQAQPWKLIAIARQLAEIHALIHSKLVTAQIPSQKTLIIEGIKNAKGVTEEEKQRVITLIRQLPVEHKLCHGDLHPGNILLSSSGPVVIDWMTGTYGDPLADLRRTMMIFETANLPPETPLYMRLIQRLSRSLLNSVYLQHYLQVNPAKKENVDQWHLPLMVARLSEVEDYPMEKQALLAQIRSLLKK